MKGGYRVKLKGGGLGKKLFQTKAAAQRQSRGPPKAGKPKAKPKAVAKSPRSNPSPAGGGGDGKKTPRMGASYQAFRSGVAAVSPATDSLLRAGQKGVGLQDSFRVKADLIKANPNDLIAHEIVVGADAALDRSPKVQQAAAISRGSATAILPEVWTGVKSFLDTAQHKDPATRLREMHREAVRMQYGYDAAFNKQDFSDPDLKTYRLAKHGGQLARFARGRSKLIHRVTEPVQRFLRLFGGTF